MSVQMLQPDWPAPAHVRAAFSLRVGGVSIAPFDTLNFGDHVNDDPAHVAHNRAALQQAINARAVFLKQVHGVDVASISAQTIDGTVADACLTQQANLACTIMVADCLPVLFTDRAGSFVAAAHAGWRGLLGHNCVGVLEQIYQRIKSLPKLNKTTPATENIAHEIMAWLGPCIGPQQFEVGAEVKAAFETGQDNAGQHFRSVGGQPSKYLADLPALAYDRLRALGVTQIFGNDGSLDWCTVSNPSQFFSHRRDAVRLGSTGRMAACIWLQN